MDPLDRRRLRADTLKGLSARKPDLVALLKHGPKTKADYDLIVSCLAFTLAEVSIYQAEQSKLPPHDH